MHSLFINSSQSTTSVDIDIYKKIIINKDEKTKKWK